mmetsp:Transcript_29177/g.47380  ORF Transcript_29177/g.47380 Transcript_29177/m.47380 type:complete len:321 (+) Transcript_29177:3-965(+)
MSSSSGSSSSSMALPALSPHSKKGLSGSAFLGKIPLDRWRVRAKLSYEIEQLDAAPMSPPSSSLPSFPPASMAAAATGRAMAGRRARAILSRRLEHGRETCDIDGRRSSGTGRGEGKGRPMLLQLSPGAVVAYEKEFFTEELPSVDDYNAPVMVRLKGKNASATVFLNESKEPIGRWLSDDEWLHRGTWANPTRELWSYTNPDHIPLPLRALRTNGRKNTLRILFKDTSSPIHAGQALEGKTSRSCATCGGGSDDDDNGDNDGDAKDQEKCVEEMGGIVEQIQLVLNDDDLSINAEGKTVRSSHAAVRGQVLIESEHATK